MRFQTAAARKRPPPKRRPSRRVGAISRVPLDAVEMDDGCQEGPKFPALRQNDAALLSCRAAEGSQGAQSRSQPEAVNLYFYWDLVTFKYMMIHSR